MRFQNHGWAGFRPLLPLLCTVLLLSLTQGLLAKVSRIRLAWQEDPTSTLTLGWHQESGEAVAVHYQVARRGVDRPDEGWAKVTEFRSENYMEMENRFAYLKDLKPDTDYQFAIRDSEGVTEVFHFRTAPDTAKPFTFIAGGDSKSEPRLRERYRKGNRMVAKLHPLFVVYAGDFISGDGLDPEGWRHWLHDWSELATTKEGRMIPIVVVRGNHEAEEEILYKLFGLHSPKNYFALSFGGDLMRFYSLNSEINIVKKGDRRSFDKPSTMENRQTQWLEKDLKEVKATFTAASYHKPIRPHTKSKSENDYLYRTWAHLFHDQRLDLVIEGDSHMHKITWPVIPSNGNDSHEGFIRNDKEGTVFTGEGSWGAPVRNNDDDKPWTRQSGKIHQFKWIHVHPDAIRMHTVILDNKEKARANSERNPFEIPEGVELFQPEGQEAVITLKPRSK